MGKSPPIGKCVHCLKMQVKNTWDHVFPKSWYPDSTPQNIAKWKVPICSKCNSNLGAVEEEFFRLVALCLNPDEPAAHGIVPRVLRSLRPTAGKSQRENTIRESLRQRMLREAREGAAIPQSGILPGLGERWGRPRDEQVAFLIPGESFRRITEKIVRGITFVVDQKFIEPPYSVNQFILDHDGSEPFRQMLDSSGEIHSCGPGIVVRRAVTPDDRTTSVYEIEFWGQFKTYASVTCP